MVARHERRSVSSDDVGKTRPTSGALSVAERRAAKQRDRREKKRVEKQKSGVPADGGRDDDRRGRAAGTTTSDPADEPDLMLDEPYEYVGMFLDDGGDTEEDEDDGTSEEADVMSPKKPRESLDADAPPADARSPPRVRRAGSFGNYGRSDGRMSLEDDEWATSERTWKALSPYLSKFHAKKVWMPFFYDGEAGARLARAGFERVVHKREDFFSKIRDGGFTRSVDVVIDNPPYTGKGMKERVLQALVDARVPFCLLLPIGVLHGASIRRILDSNKTQALIPRRCFVSKKGKKEVPFKHLVWLCHGLNLPRDLELMPDDSGEGP